MTGSVDVLVWWGLRFASGVLGTLSVLLGVIALAGANGPAWIAAGVTLGLSATAGLVAAFGERRALEDSS